MNPAVTSPSVQSTANISPRARLDYLDGLRGLAALYVVMHHAMMEMEAQNQGSGLPIMLIHATRWLIYGYGQSAVDIFIVLSGYCLMLPVARSADGQLRGGIINYFRRRAQRILPPYYAALVLFTLLILLVPSLVHMASRRWPGGGEHGITFYILLAHLLLIHNLKPDWVYRIDYPMWSVATEWQIYFVFPLLLPLCRRWGVGVAVVLGFAVGIAFATWLPQFNPAHPWFLGLFALGMTGAVIGFSSRAHFARLRTLPFWGILAIVFALIYCILLKVPLGTLHLPPYTGDTLVGLAAVCFLIFCTRHMTNNPVASLPLPLRVCSSAPAVELGVFSYSLYLVHAPIIAIIYDIASLFHPSPSVMLFVLMGIGIPIAIAFAYLFHRLFERPFMPGHPRTEKQAAHSAVVSPAP